MSHVMFQSFWLDLDGLDVDSFVTWMDANTSWWRINPATGAGVIHKEIKATVSTAGKLKHIQREVTGTWVRHPSPGSKIEILIPSKKETMLAKLTWA